MEIREAAGENHFTCRFSYFLLFIYTDYLEYFSIIACA